MSWQYYSIYTLNFKSAVPLLGYTINTTRLDEVDYVIELGKVKKPASSIPKTLYRSKSILNADFFYLEIPTIGQCLLEAGGKITLDIYDDKSTQDILPFLYDTVLSVALLYKNIFTFRASAIVGAKGVNVFCGNYGSGKSVIAAILYQNGFPFMEDNRCLFDWDIEKKQFTMKMLHPFIYLWRDIGGQIDPRKLVSQQSIRPQILKHQYHLSQPNIAKAAFPLHKLFFLNTYEEQTVQQESINGAARINLLKQYLYHHQFVDILGKADALFEFLVRLSKQLEMVNIYRHPKTEAAEFVKHIAYDINAR